jgi:hypothetical protein
MFVLFDLTRKFQGADSGLELIGEGISAGYLSRPYP